MDLKLKMAAWNANGLSQHQQEIKVFLYTHNIDILLISETHFLHKISFTLLVIHFIIQCILMERPMMV